MKHHCLFSKYTHPKRENKVLKKCTEKVCGSVTSLTSYKRQSHSSSWLFYSMHYYQWSLTPDHCLIQSASSDGLCSGARLVGTDRNQPNQLTFARTSTGRTYWWTFGFNEVQYKVWYLNMAWHNPRQQKEQPKDKLTRCSQTHVSIPSQRPPEPGNGVDLWVAHLSQAWHWKLPKSTLELVVVGRMHGMHVRPGQLLRHRVWQTQSITAQRGHTGQLRKAFSSLFFFSLLCLSFPLHWSLTFSLVVPLSSSSSSQSMLTHSSSLLCLSNCWRLKRGMERQMRLRETEKRGHSTEPLGHIVQATLLDQHQLLFVMPTEQ